MAVQMVEMMADKRVEHLAEMMVDLKVETKVDNLAHLTVMK